MPQTLLPPPMVAINCCIVLVHLEAHNHKSETYFIIEFVLAKKKTENKQELQA